MISPPRGPLPLDSPAPDPPAPDPPTPDSFAPDPSPIAPLRILILRHASYPADPRVRREAAALVAAGHRVEVLCAIEPGQARRETIGGVEVTRLPVRHLRQGTVRYLWEYGAFFVLASVTIAARSLRRPYHVVQVNTMPDALVFAAIGARWRGSALLLDLHELMPELYASKFGVPLDHPLPRLLGWIEQRAIRFADHALAVSTPCLERYMTRGASKDRFLVVMNVADPALFGPEARAGISAADSIVASSSTADPVAASSDAADPSAGSSLAESLPADALTDRARIVSHGTLVDRYGFDVLLRAMVDVPDADLVLVGDGPARPELEHLAADLGIAGRVTFTGRIALDNVPRTLAGATVGVVANRSDPFTDLVVPTKLMEYVALGIPAIVARTPAVEAYFGPHAVHYVAPGDPRDLARALCVVIEESERRQRMIRVADETFGAVHAWPLIAARYVELVELMAVSRQIEERS